MDSPTDPKTPIPDMEIEEGAPPLFSTWGRLYGTVVGYLALLIFLFYLFTIAFRVSQ